MRAYCDIGGPGAKADAFTMWICQFVGGRINVLNYYEAQGQPLAEHLAWLGWYHEKKHEELGIGLGPDHDWSSHAADAFGLMCVSYEPPRASKKLDYSGVMRRVV
jgi:hypothetical protein